MDRVAGKGRAVPVFVPFCERPGMIRKVFGNKEFLLTTIIIAVKCGKMFTMSSITGRDMARQSAFGGRRRNGEAKSRNQSISVIRGKFRI